MADEQWKKSNIVFGSAGMAASGMLPQPAEKPKPQVKAKFSDPNYSPEIEAPEEETPHPTGLESQFEIDEDTIASEEENVVAEEAPSEPDQPVEIVEVRPSLPGYGINSKAQGLFADLTVAMIGDGSREINGYNWDLTFKGIEGIKIAGISNPDESSLANMQQVHGFEGGYRDYRELLARSKPNLAVVAERDTLKKYEMIKNCLMSGAHVICPAPIAQTLDDADELIALADRRGLKFAVAYPMRLDPNLIRFHQDMLGPIGKLVEIRVYGEMDETSGGEDLLVHGAPLFDIVTQFTGRPVWCSSSIMNGNSRSTRDHVTNDNPLGPLVGDSIYANFFTEADVMVSFTSNPKTRHLTNGWGMDFIGTNNVMRLYGGSQPALSLRQNPDDSRKPDGNEEWGYWPELRDPYFVEVDGLHGSEAAHRLVIGDWLEGITKDRQADCSPVRATAALEMCHAIFHSGMTGKKVYFPIANRHHPLLPEVRPHDFTLRESA